MNKLTIINGDCINEIDKLDDDFDICLTSPPYNLYKNNFECEQWDTINKIQKYKFNKDKIENYSDFITTAVLKTLEKCKYVFLNIQGLSGNKKDIIDIQYNLKNYYCDTIIWNKGGGFLTVAITKLWPIVLSTFLYIQKIQVEQ